MNETVKVILERSSARKYRNEHVSKEDLDLIVQAGLKAPSGGNKQTPRFVVITNKAVRDRLMVMNAQVAGAPEGFDVFYGAQDVISCCQEGRRLGLRRFPRHGQHAQRSLCHGSRCQMDKPGPSGIRHRRREENPR